MIMNITYHRSLLAAVSLELLSIWSVGRSVGLSVYLSSHDLSYCNEYIQIPRTLGG